MAKRATKLCNGCGKYKALNAFARNILAGDDRQSQCRKCCARANVKWRDRRKKHREIHGDAFLDPLKKKQCSTCFAVKPLPDFYCDFLMSDGVSSRCRVCVRRKATERRKNYKAQMRRRHVARVSAARELVDAYLVLHPCIDCGMPDIDVLDFDHVRGQKKYVISTLVGQGARLETIKEEIAKCDVRCANCHRRVTRRRARGEYRKREYDGRGRVGNVQRHLWARKVLSAAGWA